MRIICVGNQIEIRGSSFMVNDYYRFLVGSNDSCFPWKNIWKMMRDPY